MSLADPPYRLQHGELPSALFLEAERQLNICNSCRYCEGYCAVFPALERRTVLTNGDISYLANLCHDCRACFYACMYAPPHEFAVNPPAILSAVRRSNYDKFTMAHWLGRLRQRLEHRRAGPIASVIGVAAVVVLALIATGAGLGVLVHQVTPRGSPYAIVTYAAILTVSLVAFACSLVAMTLGALSYWRSTRGALSGMLNASAWAKAIAYGSTLRYLRGGQEGCYLRADHPGTSRRSMHYLVAYGFCLCLVSTIAAAVEQDLFAQAVPFPFWSLPVLAGLLGGIGLVVGSIGLWYLKATQDPAPADQVMAREDRTFIVALLALGVTGLVTLGVRTTAVYGLFLTLHLVTVWACFVAVPVTKFVHLVYRMLALVQDNLEIAEEPH